MNMKKVILLVLLFSTQVSFAQFLFVQIHFVYKNEEGHAATMCFKMNNGSETESMLKCSYKLSERSFFELWGLPLANSTTVSGICESTVEANLNSLFESESRIEEFIETEMYSIRMKFISVETEVCEFELSSSYWSSYDVHFDSAGVIISPPIVVVIPNEDERTLDAIVKKIKRRCKSD
jgi:hypothetical protein